MLYSTSVCLVVDRISRPAGGARPRPAGPPGREADREGEVAEASVQRENAATSARRPAGYAGASAGIRLTVRGRAGDDGRQQHAHSQRL